MHGRGPPGKLGLARVRRKRTGPSAAIAGGPRQQFALSTEEASLIDIARRAAGLGPDAPAEVLGRGVLATTIAVGATDHERVVKLFSPAIATFLDRGIDPRTRTFARVFPIAPFFSRAGQWFDAARAVTPVEVPEVIDQGVLDERWPFVSMTRLPGNPWHRGAWRTPAEHRRGSRVAGEIAGRLHSATVTASLRQGPWLDAVAELLFFACDRIGGLHRRALAAIERARQLPLGDDVITHNDLHPANLLLDDDGAITGLIDFELAGVGPAFLDFRHLAAFDPAEFLAGYGRFDGSVAEARWLGHFADLLWQGIAIIARTAIGERDALTDARVQVEQFEHLLRQCEAPLEAAPRRPFGTRERPPAPADPIRVAVIVPTWNHFETTTGPCLRSLLWFSDLPFRVIFVDNASTDQTRTRLREAAASDPRVELVLADRNLGWAAGSIAGLARLHESDTHVLLLNSDTVVTPGWLSKLVAHLEPHRDNTVVVPTEYPDGSDAAGPSAPESPIVPGTLVAAPPPGLDAVLALADRVERQNAGAVQPGAPSGFCALFDASLVPLVRGYLDNFEGYHRGELDPHAAWDAAGLSCLIALDTFVFHARGGSGGYYRYERDRAL